MCHWEKAVQVQEADAPWKSCKGGDWLLKQRPDGIKVADQKEHNTEPTLPAFGVAGSTQ